MGNEKHEPNLREGEDALSQGGACAASPARPRLLTRRSFAGLGACAFASVMVGGLFGCSSGDGAGEQKGDGAGDPAEAPKSETRTVTNLDGSTIEVPAEVTGVAAIFGPSYERVVAVGAEDTIVCDGDFHIDGWPWSNVVYRRINDVPGIPNAHSDLNVEDLVAQGVQVVFCFPNPEQAEAINNAGMVAVPSASTGAFRDIADTVTLYANVYGTEDALKRAEAYGAYFDETVEMVRERTAGLSDADRPSVYLAYTDLLHGYGAKSDMVEVIDLAGGVLASIDLEGSSNIEVTAEQLIAWNPTTFSWTTPGHRATPRPRTPSPKRWRRATSTPCRRAERPGAGHATGVFFWDAGIQKILYLVYIAKTIHPDLFEDVDMKEMLVDFYAQFYDYDLTDDEAERILNHQDPA